MRREPRVKFLFVHQNFPGQFLHIVRHLVPARSHEIVFLTEANANEIPGVRKFAYRKPDPPGTNTHWVAREFEMAARRAEIVARAGFGLKQLGFEPDIIIGHHGWRAAQHPRCLAGCAAARLSRILLSHRGHRCGF